TELTGIGAQLKQAREAQGLAIDDVALQLKFAPRQIESLEQERFERLPGPTIARGMVRNYARLLKLDPEPLIGRLASRRRRRSARSRPSRPHKPPPCRSLRRASPRPLPRPFPHRWRWKSSTPRRLRRLRKKRSRKSRRRSPCWRRNPSLKPSPRWM